jgi:hypothetical protein
MGLAAALAFISFSNVIPGKKIQMKINTKSKIGIICSFTAVRGLLTCQGW